MKRTPLHVAAEFGHVKIVELLVQKGADATCKDFDESTPLHCAAEHGGEDVLRYLLANTKADVKARNKFGYTPNDIALNLKIRQILNGKEPESDESTTTGGENPQYGRSAYGGVLIHNDRLNAVRNLMRKHEGVNKQVGQEF